MTPLLGSVASWTGRSGRCCAGLAVEEIVALGVLRPLVEQTLPDVLEIFSSSSLLCFSCLYSNGKSFLTMKSFAWTEAVVFDGQNPDFPGNLDFLGNAGFPGRS